MTYIFRMHVGNGRNHRRDNARRLGFRIGIATVQIASAAQFHDDKNLIAVFVGFHGLDNVRMIQFFQNGNFVFQFFHKHGVRHAAEVDGFHGAKNLIASGATGRVGCRVAVFVLTVGIVVVAVVGAVAAALKIFRNIQNTRVAAEYIFAPRIHLSLETKLKHSPDQRHGEAILEPPFVFVVFDQLGARRTSEHGLSLLYLGHAPHAAHAQDVDDFVIKQGIAIFEFAGQITAQSGRSVLVGTTAGAAATFAFIVGIIMMIVIVRVGIGETDAGGGHCLLLLLWVS
mmetsp:Transcript_21612/g.59973  ORF Transcript_21612/g.59973 Transcript_21612/m.59973 type:complete len:285 (+) Transcript_21612:474-1328(+)